MAEVDDSLSEDDVGTPNVVLSATDVSRKRGWLTVFQLEILFFLLFFAYASRLITTTSLILDKVCLSHFGYSSDTCKNLDNLTDIKARVETVSSNFQITYTILQIVPAAILSIFFGPWSDRYGRKLPISIALTGMIIDSVGSTVCAVYLDSSVGFLLACVTVNGIFGGLVTSYAIVLSYASDLTEVSERTSKYALLEMASGFAQPFGYFVSGWLLKFYGYPPVYALSTGALILCLLWVVFQLPETRGSGVPNAVKFKLTTFFSCAALLDGFNAVTAERPNKGRTQILLLVSSLGCIVISIISTHQISFLYVHHQFNWSSSLYSTLTAMYSLCTVVLVMILLPCLKRYNAADPLLGILGTTSVLLKNIAMAFAYKTAVFHIASILGFLAVLGPMAVKSRISKVIAGDELGKVFSFVAIADTLVPVLGSVLVSQTFNAFIDIFPGMPYLILASFLILPLICFSWMSLLPPVNYENLHRILDDESEVDFVAEA